MRRILLVAVFVLAASPTFAQTGQVNGVVTDNTGGVVPGAVVKAVEVGMENRVVRADFTRIGSISATFTPYA